MFFFLSMTNKGFPQRLSFFSHLLPLLIYNGNLITLKIQNTFFRTKTWVEDWIRELRSQ